VDVSVAVRARCARAVEDSVLVMALLVGTAVIAVSG